MRGYVRSRAVTAVVADPAPLAPQTTVAGTVYTCPMHPEMLPDHASACPKCGMALAPGMPTLDDGESPEPPDFKRRFVWTLPLTIVVQVLAMAGYRPQWFQGTTQRWIKLMLTLPIVAVGGFAVL